MKKEEINARKRAAYAANRSEKLTISAPYKDVTDRWFSGEKKSTPKATPLSSYTAPDGTVYPVDGWHVKQKHDINEKMIAKTISEKVRTEVFLVPKVEFPPEIQTPDYIVFGRNYDLKQITGSGKNTLSSASQKKEKQSHNFVFDLSKSGLSEEGIDRQIAGIYRSTHTRFVDEIVIVNDFEIIKVWKRK